MSVRAYRVIEIRQEQADTFNLWHDEKLVEFLDSQYGFFETLHQGTGLTELRVEALEHALSEVPMDEEVKQALQKDIEACGDNGYVVYYCY